MRITSVSAFCTRINLQPVPYSTTEAGTKIEWGRRSRLTPNRPTPAQDFVLAKIETDEGLVGWGETQPDIGFFGETTEQVQAAIQDYLGLHLVGREPLDRAGAMHCIDFRGNGCAKAALDMALHDLAGKALKVPVASLLGGTTQRRAQVVLEVAGGTVEGMATWCAEMCQKGVRAFKAKIGGCPAKDADRLQAIRDAVGPQVSLRTDANQGYSPKEAIQFCALAERRHLDIQGLEQPVAAHDLPGMRLVRQSVGVPIVADESCFTPQDALAIIRHDAADYLNVKLSKAGGFFGALKIVALAEAAGIGCVIGTSFGLGLEIAAKLHLLGAAPHASPYVEFTELANHPNHAQSPFDSLLALPLHDGCLKTPEAPGLGVELELPEK